MSEDSGHYRRPIVHNVYNEPIDLFDRHLYEKGSLVLHMIRTVLGDDLWRKAIHYYVDKHKGTDIIAHTFKMPGFLSPKQVGREISAVQRHHPCQLARNLAAFWRKIELPGAKSRCQRRVIIRHRQIKRQTAAGYPKRL